MGRLVKKGGKWEWTPEINKNFELRKKEITEALCRAHFDPMKVIYITKDAFNTG